MANPFASYGAFSLGFVVTIFTSNLAIEAEMTHAAAYQSYNFEIDSNSK